MAVQNPFFGKRDNETFSTRSSASGTTLGAGGSYGSAAASSSAASSASSTAARSTASAVSNETSGSKLTVGPNIKLKGVEITDCDTLVVEGTVEATMNSRVIQIAEQGAFRGSAEIDIAEIHGEFDGNLTVRQKLVIFSTGRVTGSIRYGKIVIEEGGQLSGDIHVGVAVTAAASSSHYTGSSASTAADSAAVFTAASTPHSEETTSSASLTA